MKPNRIAIIAREPPDGNPATTGGGLVVRLALMLGEAGHDVEICFAGGGAERSGTMGLRRTLGRRGIRLACLYLTGTDDLRASLAVMCWLRTARADLAIFVDAVDLGYFAAMARRTRTDLLGTALAAVVLDAPGAERGRDGRFVSDPGQLLADDVARVAARSFNLVATLNPVAKAWADRALEGVSSVKRLDLPCPPLALIPVAPPTDGPGLTLRPPCRLVLCGTISLAGALEPCIELIARLSAAWPAALGREIAVVGQWQALPNGECAALLAQRMATGAGIAIRWIDPGDYVASIQSGQTGNDFALFLEDGPASFDVLAAYIGCRGLARLVETSCYTTLLGEAAGAMLVGADPVALAEACARPGRDEAALTAASANFHTAARQSNANLLAALANALSVAPLEKFRPERQPRVSVCISHFNRPVLLAQAIRSLEAQDYPNVEVVIVDDASPDIAAKEYIAALSEQAGARGWIILRNETEQWQQESRNIAARHATGDYVLIMDDDNCARPDEISTMVAVAEGLGVPIVRCLQGIFEGDDYPKQVSDETRVDFFPTGGPLAVGTMWNVFGDVNVMFRRETFLALGGFGKTEGLGCEDFEIGIRAALAGIEAVTIPRVLYDYRMSAVNMAKSMNNKRLYDSHARLSALYEGEVPPAVAPVFRLLNQNFHRIWQRDGHAYWTRPIPAPDSFRARVLKAHPLEAEGLLYLAGILAEEGALSDAESLTRFLHESFPNDTRVSALMHRILLMRGRITELRQWHSALNGRIGAVDLANLAAVGSALGLDG